MGDLKYVMFTNGVQYIPIIFSDIIPHVCMVEAIQAYPGTSKLAVVSAGFIQADNFQCYGDSDSLKIQSRPEDSEIIQFYPWDHGLHNTEIYDILKSTLRSK